MANQHTNYHEHISINPHILGGKPVIKGTRIPVEIVLARLAHDLDTKTLFVDYPQLTQEDVKAILHYTQVIFDNPMLYIAAQQTLEAQDKKTSNEEQDIKEVLSLAGAWGEIGEEEWEQVEHTLNTIRHASPPTPPIELDL